MSVEQLSWGEQMSSDHLSALKLRVSTFRMSICRVRLSTSPTYLTPFNFRPPLIFGRGGRKLEGPKFFKNPFITLNKNEKNVIYRRWPKIKGAELGEGGRKLEGPKIKGAEN